LPITGVPTYGSIAELNLQLNINAASVQSNLGDGLLGLLYLTISPAKYNTLSAVPFIPPANPGAAPVIPAGATGPQISAIIHQHGADLKLFKEYLAIDKMLIQQVIGAINTMYLQILSHCITGFANVTTQQFILHLYTNYARLSPVDKLDTFQRVTLTSLCNLTGFASLAFPT
jgi:hypothetical protein